MEQSPHWKRVDVRKKKITRGLSFLTKDFIKKWMRKLKIKKEEFFERLDELLIKHFKYIHREKRIQAFGGIGKIVLLCKFEGLVSKSTYLTAREKPLIIEFGREYTHLKNKCSTAEQRTLI